jgi:hypothetical protein
MMEWESESRGLAKVIARYVDGRIVKGHTWDFDPTSGHFHLTVVGAVPDSRPLGVRLRELKALFFVKDFEGTPEYSERKEFNHVVHGRKLAVHFTDGEILVGTTATYDQDRHGFFLFPADRFSNNDKVYVMATAVADVRPL